MDYVDYDDSRPRLLFSARSTTSSSSAAANATNLHLNRPSIFHVSLCYLSAAALFFFAFNNYTADSSFLSFLLFWVSLSLVLGPFSPPSLTGGDPTVGRGTTIPEVPLDHLPRDPTPDRHRSYGGARRRKESDRSARDRQVESEVHRDNGSTTVDSTDLVNVDPTTSTDSDGPPGLRHVDFEDRDKQNGSAGEKEWTEEEFELLKKQMLKNPAGKAHRWELIAAAFEGRHSVSSVIIAAKGLAEKRAGDSYAQFLKQRKPIDRRVNEELLNGSKSSVGNSVDEIKKEEWSTGEDLALLNALKAYAKDVAMRWEKIAAAVPGKSKASCMKRVVELKKDFRSSKALEA